MGVTLHYKGKLKSLEMIEEITSELLDIAVAKEWKYQIINPEDFDKEIDPHIPLIKGIMAFPNNCDPLTFTFINDGRLISPMISLFSEKDINKFLAEDSYYAFTKTQNAGVETHIEIVNLLKYLSQKYFEVWECIDDSGYYHTGDKQNLIKTLGVIDSAMEALEDAFEVHAEMIDNSKPEEIVNFISEVLAGQDLDIQIVNSMEEE